MSTDRTIHRRYRGNGSFLFKLIFSFTSLLMVFTVSAADCHIAGKHVVLSNDRIIVEIDPAAGGRVVRLYDKKSNTELTGLAGSAGGSGLFSEGLYESGNVFINKIFQDKVYAVVSRGQGTVAHAKLRTPDGLPLTIEKTYSLQDGSDRLSVAYEITNPGEDNYTGSLYINNGIRIAGDSRYTMEFPEGFYSKNWSAGPQQVRNRFIFEPGKSRPTDHFVHRPIRDYVMISGEKSGVVLEVPFPFLDFFYSYCGGAGCSAIADWFTIPFQLPPLSKGKKDAVLHAVLEDALAAYKLRFETGVRVIDPEKFSYEKFRAPSKEAKSDAFTPRIGSLKMNTDFRTPAIIRERKPLRKIKLAAVALACGNHEMGQLNRRLNTEMYLIDTGSVTSFKPSGGFGWKMPMPETELSAVLKREPDIILLTGHHESSMPKKIKQQLKRAVENGAAFIYVSSANNFRSIIPGKGGKDLPPELFRGMCKDKLPGFGQVKEFKLGKGKVIHVRSAMEPYGMEWTRDSRMVVPHVVTLDERFFYWEYYISFYGRLFRYAANVKSPAEIRDITVDAGVVTATVKADKAIPQSEISLILDTPSGRLPETVIYQGALKAGDNRLTIRLPAEKVFQSGEYHAFLSLSSSAGTLDWFDVSFNNRGAAAITALVPAKRVFDKDAPVTGAVTVAGQGKLVLKLREAATGRVVARQMFPAAKGTVNFSLKREIAAHHKLYKVEAQLFHSGKAAAADVKNVLIRPAQANPEKILPLVWGAHHMSWVDRHLNEYLRDAGFRVFKAPQAAHKTGTEILRECDDVLLYGMDYAPLGVEHIRSKKPAKEPYTIRNRCLREPSYQKHILNRAEKLGNRMTGTLSDYCFIADEITLGHYFSNSHDYCLSPWCLPAFQQAMKAKYHGDLNKLNRNWKTAFASWDKVRPHTLAEAEKTGNFVSCQEHRLFMMGHLTEICRLIADTVKNLSGTETGMSGMGATNVYEGFDQSAMMAFLKCSTVYHTPFMLDQLRSLMTPGHTTGSYTDYGIRYKVWEQLIAGLKMPSIWWYAHLMRRGDSQLSKEGLLLKQMFASIRDSGAAHVLGYGARKSSPVTLVWSTASLVAATVGRSVEPVSNRNYHDVLDSWSQLIRDMGMDSANVISDSGLKSITPATHPVVILPCALRLSDENIKHLEQYVKAGGTLIADLYPGKFDEFGVVRKNNPLHRLFGIAGTGAQIIQDPALSISGRSFLSVLWGNRLSVAPDVQVTLPIVRKSKEKRLGSIRFAGSNESIPGGLFRKYGKGRTLYLNFFFDRYNALYSKSDVSGIQVREVMQKVFELAGLDMKHRHQLPGGAMYAEYALGSIRYLFLSRRAAGINGNFTLKSNTAMHWYDMLQGKYLGKASSLQGTLPGNGVRFVGLFPEKLGEFSGKISFDGRNIRIQAERKHPGFQEPLRLKVFRNGKEIQLLSETLMLENRLQWQIDLGLEPTPGEWQIRLTAVADNRSVEYRFNVEK